jgi:glycosyltransferase involved in cell wall biosynthesis
MELGGAESHILTLSKALIDRGHSVHLAAPEGPSSYQLNELQIIHHKIEVKKTSKLIENLLELFEIIKRYKIDIVHVHPFQSQVVAGLLPFLTNVPIVTTIHGPYLTPSTNKLKFLYNNFILVSEEINRHHFQRKLICDSDKVEIIPNSVPINITKDERNIFNKVLKISYISRLDNDKFASIKFFLKSIEKISPLIEVEVSVIGKGGKLEEIISLINKINRKIGKNIITIIKGTTTISNYIEKSDVIVGVGRVILEAIALKKIAICMGNKHYVGIVDSSNLLEISKVNFTDRACTEKLSTDLFIRDLKSIQSREIQREKEKTHNLFKAHFDINFSAEKHEKFYNEMIQLPLPNEIDLQYINAFNDDLYEASSIYEGIKLIQEGYSYTLYGTKQFKILISPNFENEKDNWKNILIYLLDNDIILEQSTLVIRIENHYLEEVHLILKEIENIISKYESSTLDILVDCEFQDSVTQVLFLEAIDLFIPTSQLTSTELKCLLLKKEVLSNTNSIQIDKLINKCSLMVK